MGDLVIHTLGQPAVYHGGEPVVLPTRKSLALLIYLAVEGGQSRERLAALLWPASKPEAGRAALRNTLTFIRRALHDGQGLHMQTSHAQVALVQNHDLAVDLRLLEATAPRSPGAADLAALQAALDSYRGDVLAGFNLSDAPEFDDWATVQRERAYQLLHQIAAALVAAQVAARNIPAALGTITRWIGLSPLHEPAYRELLQLQLASGDRVGARRTSEAYHAMLAREFGFAAPADALIDVAAPVATRPVLDHRSPAARLDLPFTGRESEHHLLSALFGRTRRGAAQAVRLEGEAGAGKTRLARELLQWASGQGATVVSGRAFEVSTRLPYQAFTDAWRGWLEQERAPVDLLADIWLVELSRLFPELRERYPDLEQPRDDPGAQGRLYEAVVRFGLAVARRGALVFMLDDLQWVDDATRDLLLYAARRWSEAAAPILLILTVRSEDLGPRTRLAGWFGEIARACPVERIVLGTFVPATTSGLVEQLLGGAASAESTGATGESEALANWLQRQSSGVPLLLAELIAALVDRGFLRLQRDHDGAAPLAVTLPLHELDQALRPMPGGIREVILTRLAPLSPAAFAMLGAAAVLGQRSTFAVLGGVAELDAAHGPAALDELLERRLIQLADSPETELEQARYLIAHDTIRDVVYTELGAGRRQRCHGLALLLLEREAAGPAELARHALAARQLEAAWHHSLAAGDAAMQLFAVRAALAHYQQAQRLLGQLDTAPPAERLYLRLGRAYELLHQLDGAAATYQELLAYARQTSAPALIVGALNRLATLTVQRGAAISEGEALLAEAHALAEHHGDAVGVAETAWNLAQLGVYAGSPATTIEHGQRALRVARRIDQPELIARALNVLALGYYNYGSWEQMELAAAEAAAIYGALHDRAMKADSLVLVGNAQALAGRVRDGLATGRQALTIAESLATPWGQTHALIHLGMGLIDAGQYEEALTIAERGVALAEQHRIIPLAPYVLMVLGAARRALFQLDAAIDAHRAALAANAMVTYQPFTELIQSELCADYALAGAWHEAHQHARAAWEARRYEIRALSLTRWLEIEALLRADDSALAYEDAARLRDAGLADGFGPPSLRYELVCARIQAALARHAGDIETAQSALEGAAALADSLTLSGERWQILAALGQCAAELGQEQRRQAAVVEGQQIIAGLAQAIADEPRRAAFLAAARRYCSLGLEQ